MNLQIIATLIAALSFVATGFGLAWHFGKMFAELRARDDAMAARHVEMGEKYTEQKTAVARLEAALVELPFLLRRVAQIEEILPRFASAFSECPRHIEATARMEREQLRLAEDVRALHEKIGRMRGRLDSVTDLNAAGEET